MVKRSRLKLWLPAVAIVPVVMLTLMIGGVVGLYFQPPGVQRVMQALGLAPGGGTTHPIAVPALGTGLPRAPAVATPPPPAVVGLGKILPDSDVVTVAPPFGSGDARVAAITVREGDRVDQGAILALLDNERPLRAALASAEATVASRSAVLDQVRAATRASREEATAALARAESAAQSAAREYDRSDELRRRGVSTDQVLDQRRATRDEASREVERLRATLSRFGAGDIDAQPDVVVAARNLEQARSDLDRARADMDKATVRAPRASTVLSIAVQPGERPGTLGILNLGDLEHMKAEVEVYQTMIGRVAIGQSVELRAEALPRPLVGTVTRIGLEVGRQTLTDASPAANTDARVVRVMVGLDPASTVIARRYTNLQVTARFAREAGP